MRHQYTAIKSHEVTTADGFTGTEVDQEYTRTICERERLEIVEKLERVGFIASDYAGDTRYTKPGSDWTYTITGTYAPDWYEI